MSLCSTRGDDLVHRLLGRLGEAQNQIFQSIPQVVVLVDHLLRRVLVLKLRLSQLLPASPAGSCAWQNKTDPIKAEPKVGHLGEGQ